MSTKSSKVIFEGETLFFDPTDCDLEAVEEYLRDFIDIGDEEELYVQRRADSGDLVVMKLQEHRVPE